MKVLWITNAPFPKVSGEINSKITIKGWVYSAAEAFVGQHPNIKLAVASFYSGKELRQIELGNTIHYLLPDKVRADAANHKHDSFWLKIKDDFKPDIVHIHGSEYPYSYAYVRACGSENVVLSIQGLISIIERYYYGGIKTTDLLKSVTLRDIIRLDTVFSQRNRMKKRSKYERLIIRNINHIIGRTSWDRNHALTINPDINYHFCNETLRPLFYKNKWNLLKCEKYSIVISQAYYPLKGFHQLVKALPLVLKHYPETKVYVTGRDAFSNKGILINGFGNYINKLIHKYNLSEHIIFSGLLSEEAMCQRYMDSHLFICPSAIENSSNSIGEAQLLGMPCIASFAGGNPDLIEHGESGLLYRFEEFEMLATNICKVFEDDKLALKISANAKVAATSRHNKEINSTSLYEIYSKITVG